jgi:hypothetical protein
MRCACFDQVVGVTGDPAMEEVRTGTAVGAGTTAGDAEDEIEEPESRAAQAELDEDLESLRVTGARLTGISGSGTRTGLAPAAANLPGAPLSGAEPIAPSKPTPARPERPREELRRNEAGIASRLDRR